ncbi:MAG TPA: glycosyltransferase family A protein [Aggregatilineales bacterium]|nr:glycosyltransferase family 2 protein [Chloroflexota bacterium]HOA22965.1 glycosyltransferase family A protein [Aggregatilineales bacterium]HPV07903.1 glycosyltransferase family A protein [Aggregatilineales bacterium]HQA66786.1 glycosyltransferase family A protein [Aggregatilineales bacterium]HQE17929.1 glycosyltransferase family A protein [Aggregatilineales bacterium]
MSHQPRITFGMIVLNGEPFTRYNLRALYPFAHEIIVVEGAAPGAAGVATPDGHSRDGTLEALHRFKAEEDPDDKLQIITRDGFWSEKDEMSRAYAERATGDYLWQVDVDEFYHPDDMRTLLRLLANDPGISAVSFPTLTFWGAPQVRVDSWYLRLGNAEFHRLFRWGPGYRYATHRPPTVLDAQGRDTRSLKWLSAADMARRGIYLYHYSLLFPKQVVEKCDYYSRAEWARRSGAARWAEESFLRLERPFRVHNVYRYPGWLEPFAGEHPPQIEAMWAEAVEERRAMNDVEALLASPTYRAGRALLKAAFPLFRLGSTLWETVKPPLRTLAARTTPRLYERWRARPR